MFVKNDGRASLLAASLAISLVAALIICGTLANVSPASASPGNLALTLTTNKTSYSNGETIHISGNVKDAGGAPVDGAVVTIRLSCGEWSRRLTANTVASGDYAVEYIISLGDQSGTWTILASAVDDGNSGENSRTIDVSLPPIHYTVGFLSPSKNVSISRGSPVTLSLRVEENGNPVTGADVVCRLPKNDDISLSAGTQEGTYSATYTLKWDDPLENWCISVEVEKITGSGTKVGGYYTIVDIQPAVLQLELLSPSGLESVVGEQTEIKVRVLYPDGTPVEGATTTVSMAGYENIVFAGEGNGVYKSNAISFEDSGGLPMSLVVEDANGNTGSGSYVLNIVSAPLPSGVVFLLAVVAVVLAIGVSSAVLTQKKISLTKLEKIRAEKKHIAKLQTEAAKKYFKDGSISRETYDSLMHEHARRLAELNKEERKRTGKASKEKI